MVRRTKRRALLASVGAGAIASVGGCLVESGSSDDQDDDGAPTGDAVVTSTEIADQPCPPYEVDSAGAVCSHTVDTDAAAVYLETDRERSSIANGLPVDRITLTLHNESAEELSFDPHGWRLRHNDGSGWEEVQPAVRRDGDDPPAGWRGVVDVPAGGRVRPGGPRTRTGPVRGGVRRPRPRGPRRPGRLRRPRPVRGGRVRFAVVQRASRRRHSQAVTDPSRTVDRRVEAARRALDVSY